MNSNLRDRVCYLFDYRDGNLIRKTHQSSNARIGDVAGWLDKSSGYLRVRVDRKMYLVHRLIYLIHTGLLPSVVDHMDGNILNNKIENLRESDEFRNRWNCLGNEGSISGVKGVYQDGGRWKAMVNVDKKRYYLGMYDTIEEAAEIVRKKYEELQGDRAASLSRA